MAFIISKSSGTLGKEEFFYNRKRHNSFYQKKVSNPLKTKLVCKQDIITPTYCL